MKKDGGTIIQYQLRTLKFVLIIYSISAFLAGTLFVFLKLLNYYKEINWVSIGIIALITIFELVTFKLMYNITTKNDELNQKAFNALKTIILIFSYINYLFLCFIVPSKELWVSVFYFIILGAMFLDNKLDIASILLGIVCQAIIFIFNPSTLPGEEFLVREMILRVVVISLTSFGIYIFTFFASSLLKTVEKNEDELKRNHENIVNLFSKVSEYAQALLASSQNLAAIAEEETVSIEGIANTSQGAAKDADTMMGDITENNRILNELLNTNKSITERVKDTEHESGKLIELSNANEEALNEALSIITGIKESIGNTLDATNVLEEKSKQIDEVLLIIRQISEQTNLLALNASIEAARAGELGKGFAVVAEEIRKLAVSTHQSLNEVSSITSEFKERVSQVENLMVENTEKVSHGDSILKEVVINIKEMINGLKDAGKNINEISSLTNTMLSETQNVVEVNTNFSNSTSGTINNFNLVFGSINENLAMSQELASSAESIKTIAEDMNKLID